MEQDPAVTFGESFVYAIFLGVGIYALLCAVNASRFKKPNVYPACWGGALMLIFGLLSLDREFFHPYLANGSLLSFLLGLLLLAVNRTPKRREGQPPPVPVQRSPQQMRMRWLAAAAAMLGTLVLGKLWNNLTEAQLAKSRTEKRVAEERAVQQMAKAAESEFVYTFEDSGFSIVFPGKPRTRLVEASPAVGDMEMVQYVLEEGLLLQVDAYRMTDEHIETRTPAYMENETHRLIEHMGHYRSVVNVAESDGLYIVSQSSTELVRREALPARMRSMVRTYYSDKYAFRVITGCYEDQFPRPEFAKFFDSLRYQDKPVKTDSIEEYVREKALAPDRMEAAEKAEDRAASSSPKIFRHAGSGLFVEFPVAPELSQVEDADGVRLEVAQAFPESGAFGLRVEVLPLDEPVLYKLTDEWATATGRESLTEMNLSNGLYRVHRTESAVIITHAGNLEKTEQGIRVVSRMVVRNVYVDRWVYTFYLSCAEEKFPTPDAVAFLNSIRIEGKPLRFDALDDYSSKAAQNWKDPADETPETAEPTLK